MLGCQETTQPVKAGRGTSLKPWLLGLCLLTVFHPTVRAAQQQDDAVFAALQQGSLQVWAPRNAVMGLMNDPTARLTPEY